jgi:hypothetical protein
MAEILIRAKTNGPTGAHWQRGDIVCIVDDGWQWGRLETLAAWAASGGTATNWLADFYLLKVPGVSRQTLEGRGFLLEQNTATGAARRNWRFAVDSLPNQIRNRLNNDGEVSVGSTITRAQAESVLLNKTTATNGSLA